MFLLIAKVLDMRITGWNLTTAVEFLNDLGPEGREIYGSVYTSYNPIPLDILVPILGLILFSMLLSLLYGDSVCVVLPLIAFSLDMMENFMIERILDSYPNVSQLENIGRMGGILTTAKAFTNYLVFLLLFVGFMLKIKNFLSHSSVKKKD